jgi:mono/diheme cytochrome c family protein
MKSLCKYVAFGLLGIATLPLFTQTGRAPASAASNAEANKREQASAVHPSNGERKFAQNCGRCHTPPEGFSPHISRTIVLHMRVRASLSKQDEEDILHFLNP